MTRLWTSNSVVNWRNQEPWWLRHGVAPYLLFGDCIAFTVAAVLTRPPSALHLLVLVVNVILFSLAGLYRSRLSLSLLDDLPYVIGAVLVGAALKVTLFGLVGHIEAAEQQLAQAGVLLIALCAVRRAAYTVVKAARRWGFVRHRTVIVGAGELGVRLASTMLEHRYYGLDPVGFVDGENPRDLPPLPVAHLGGYPRLAQIIRQHAIRDVVVAFGDVPETDLLDILGTCDRLDVEVFFVPRLYELHNAKRDTDDLWGIPLIRTRKAAFRSPWWRLKRLGDIVLSALALLVLSPVLLVCALAVRYEGGPGIIFRQERVGLDGRVFQVLKFRSLKPSDESESQTNWNIQHDHRVGRVGRFLRSTSLDELPQLWNILRGDMSIVGPRPERPHFVDQFSAHIPRYTARHRVPAGLTGWAQAHGLRGDTSIEDRARFDNYYIENWSLWLDARILVKTIGQVLRRQGG